MTARACSRTVTNCLGNSESEGVSLGDLDGDGDLDAFVANEGSNLPDPDEHPNRVWLNDGSGNFTDRAAAWGIRLVAA